MSSPANYFGKRVVRWLLVVVRAMQMLLVAAVFLSTFAADVHMMCLSCVKFEVVFARLGWTNLVELPFRCS